MIDPIAKLFDDVQYMLEQMNYPEPHELARALDLRVIGGPVAAINLEPPPTIHIPDYLRGFKRSHTLAHEIAHALMRWREIDDELLAYYAPECACANLEALANHVAGLICFPEPFYKASVKRYGFTPDLMIHMARSTGAPIPLAMDRAIYESDSYNRAALLFQGKYLARYSSTVWLDVSLWDRIPDPKKQFPDIVLKRLEPGVILGTWGA